MAISPLFQGLAAPAPLKLDTSGLDTFLEKLLQASIKTDEEVQSLKQDNAALRKELASAAQAAKDAAAAAAGASNQKDSSEDIKSLRLDVKALTERVAQLEAKNQELETMMKAKADKSAIDSALAAAEAAKSTADSVASEFAGLKVESTKALKDTRQQVLSLTEKLHEEVGTLATSKASKSDVVDLKRIVEGMKEVMSSMQSDVESTKKMVSLSLEGIDSKIAGKADASEVSLKMGRMECDDLIHAVQNGVADRLKKVQKDSQELRDDLDVILSMLMQDASIGAGMLRCLSCEKPVTLHKPGPPAGYGREPVIVQGDDRKFYRGDKRAEAGGGAYSPRWPASSASPDRDESPAKPKRPQSAKARV